MKPWVALGWNAVPVLWERDPEAVRGEVRDGFVTLEGARCDFGVTLDRETLEICETETQALRAAMAPASASSRLEPPAPARPDLRARGLHCCC